LSQIAFILGRSPELSKAELQAVYPGLKFDYADRSVCIVSGLALELVDLRRLGGVVKVAEIVAQSPKPDYKLLASMLAQRHHTGKLHYGITALGALESQLKTFLIGVKKELVAHQLSARFLNKDFKNLTSAQVELQGLTRGKGYEVILIPAGGQCYYAVTHAVQPFDEYKSRDYEKRVRDAKVGMLPPKLAQMLINLAGVTRGSALYDPFCGTGTVLIEAGLLGYTVLGSDLDPRMVAAAEANLVSQSLAGETWVADAAVPRTALSADVVVSEGYLGPPRRTVPNAAEHERIFAQLTELYTNLFSWLPVSRVVVTLPVYMQAGRVVAESATPITRAIQAKTTWRRVDSGKLLYVRPDQTVGRQVTIWQRSA
jgi:SAM-dependent methyltransferase